VIPLHQAFNAVRYNRADCSAWILYAGPGITSLVQLNGLLFGNEFAVISPL